MKAAQSLYLMSLALGVAGCGGGSSSGPPSYGFVTPLMNSQRTYAVTDTNPTSTSLNIVIRTVSAVNSDGSFSYSESVQGGTVNGPNFIPGDYSADSTGRLLSATFNPGTAGAKTCTDSPHGPGPVFPLTVGATWQSTYVVTCGSGTPATYTEMGSVVDTETVTVTAGTFTAVKVRSTISLDICPGICPGPSTETLTEWLDAANGQPLKAAATYNYGSAETLTTITLTSEARELQSQSGPADPRMSIGTMRDLRAFNSGVSLHQLAPHGR